MISFSASFGTLLDVLHFFGGGSIAVVDGDFLNDNDEVMVAAVDTSVLFASTPEFASTLEFASAPEFASSPDCGSETSE